MKALRFITGLILLAAVAGGAFVLLRHPEWITRSAHEEDEKEPQTDVPVKVAHVQKATLHGYVEGFGIVVLEANARGVPVIASDGVPEGAVQEGRNGLRYRFGDIDSLAGIMTSDLLQQLGHANRESLARSFPA